MGLTVSPLSDGLQQLQILQVLKTVRVAAARHAAQHSIARSKPLNRLPLEVGLAHRWQWNTTLLQPGSAKCKLNARRPVVPHSTFLSQPASTTAFVSRLASPSFPRPLASGTALWDRTESPVTAGPRDRPGSRHLHLVQQLVHVSEHHAQLLALHAGGVRGQQAAGLQPQERQVRPRASLYCRRGRCTCARAPACALEEGGGRRGATEGQCKSGVAGTLRPAVKKFAAVHFAWGSPPLWQHGTPASRR